MNRVVVDHRPMLLMVSAESLFPIVIPAKNVKDLPARLPQIVGERLKRLGVADRLIDAAINAMSRQSGEDGGSRCLRHPRQVLNGARGLLRVLRCRCRHSPRARGMASGNSQLRHGAPRDDLSAVSDGAARMLRNAIGSAASLTNVFTAELRYELSPAPTH